MPSNIIHLPIGSKDHREPSSSRDEGSATVPSVVEGHPKKISGPHPEPTAESSSPSVPACQIIEGDSLLILPKMERESCKICITSVPTWEPQRDSNPSHELPSTNWGDITCPLGSEPTSRQYISHLVKLFRHTLRLIRKDGCLIILFPDNPESGEMGLPWKFAFELQQFESHLIAEIFFMNTTGGNMGYTDVALVFTKPKSKVQPRVIIPISEENVSGQSRGLISVRMAEVLINTFTQAGDIVLDPLAGTGSVAAAAVKLQRPSISIDINSGCTQIIKRRVKAVNLTFDNFEYLGDKYSS